MKKQDFIVIIGCVLFFGLFFVIEPLKEWFLTYSKGSYKDLMAFLKFGVLATLGECIGLRIQKGVYNEKGFGILPRAIVWGILGVTISMAIAISAFLLFLMNLGVTRTACFFNELLFVFAISVSMNCIFAPVFMTFHKITDMHILSHGGTVGGFFCNRLNMSESFKKINWDVQWGFVFKKTIPFFWIPAHTITFMLPPQFRVLFAAFLGVALGVILSIAARKKK